LGTGKIGNQKRRPRDENGSRNFVIGKMLKIHLALTVTGAMVWGAFGSGRQVESFGLAAAIGAIQLAIIIWCWFRVLAKKSIALPGSVIVIKYAVLGVLIYRILVDHWVDPLAFLTGLGMMVITVVIFGYVQIHDSALEVF
jgi:hypothetical protein